ncbi:MAG: ubiquinol-cytochrome c reductase iron-sulfur subunit [Anaerolineae bacterium]
MVKRSPAEIQAQREAWLARKNAKALGQDVPPAEAPASVVEAMVEPVVETAPEPVVAAPEPITTSTAAPVAPPQAPERKRTPEEVRAQREAFMAAKAARAAGAAAAPPPPPAPKPVEVAPAPPPPAPKPADGAAKAAPKPPAAAPAPKPAAEKAAPAPEADGHLTRREFLNYAWLASLALFTAQTIGASLWFAFPNFKAGQFGGEFPIGDVASALPQVNAPPKPYTDGKFWLVNLDTQAADGSPKKGIMAIYKVCTHLGCLYDWQTVTSRFECPCHGSKFTLAGDYIEGPARRSLDRFVIKVVDAGGAVLAQTDEKGDPLDITGNENAQLIIDTGAKILGKSV